MKKSQIALWVVAALGAAAAGSVFAVDVPANVRDYVEFGGLAVALAAVLGSLGVRFFGNRPNPLDARVAAADRSGSIATPATGSGKRRAAPPMQDDVPSNHRLVMTNPPGGKLTSNDVVAAAAAAVVPPKVKAAPDNSKRVEVTTKELPNGKVQITVAGKNYSGQEWNDHLWQKQLLPLQTKRKLILWADKQKGENRFLRRGTVDQANLATVLEEVGKVKWPL